MKIRRAVKVTATAELQQLLIQKSVSLVPSAIRSIEGIELKNENDTALKAQKI